MQGTVHLQPVLCAEGLWRLTCTDQLPQQFTPLCAKLIGSRQTPISTNDTQVSDAPFDQVVRSLEAALLCLEILTASTADDCAPLKSIHVRGWINFYKLNYF